MFCTFCLLPGDIWLAVAAQSALAPAILTADFSLRISHGADFAAENISSNYHLPLAVQRANRPNWITVAKPAYRQTRSNPTASEITRLCARYNGTNRCETHSLVSPPQQAHTSSASASTCPPIHRPASPRGTTSKIRCVQDLASVHLCLCNLLAQGSWRPQRERPCRLAKMLRCSDALVHVLQLTKGP
jgi:hypothetical protein